MCLPQQKSTQVDKRLSETVDSGLARVLTIMLHFKQRRQRGILLRPPNFALISAIPVCIHYRMLLQARKARI